MRLSRFLPAAHWLILVRSLCPAGTLALLSEEDPTLLHYALDQLNSSLVHAFWAEISDEISLIEVVYENTALPLETRQLAALLASKVYYHLASLDDALAFALSAEGLFKVEPVPAPGPGVGAASSAPANGDQDYTDTIIAACIDRYIDSRIVQEEGGASAKTGTVAAATEQDMQKMQKIVEQMWNRCIRDGEYRQAMGIALDARRLDVIERVFNEAKGGAGNGQADLLSYVLEAVMTVVVKREFRDRVSQLNEGRRSE